MRRQTSHGILLMVVTALACAPRSNTSPTPDSGTSDAGDAGDAGDSRIDGGAADAGVDCGDPLAPAGADCGTLSWSMSPVASRLRNHQFSFIADSDAGPHLYVLGGINYATYLPNADMAAIRPDGSLGPFGSTTPLEVGVAGLSGARVGNVVVIGGGHAAGRVLQETYTSTIQADGTLGPWAGTGTMLHPRMHGGAVASGDTVYFIGGFDGISKVWDDVVSATVQPDGSLSAWANAGTLPQPLSHFSAVLVGSRVYLAGGLNKSAYVNPPMLSNVYQGTIAADGTLGAWTDMTPLPVPIATHASFVYGGRIYVAGGVDGTPAQEDRVWSVPINADGTLGTWQSEAPLPIKRAHVHQLPMFENHFYSVAGAIDFELNSTTEIDLGVFQ